MLPVAAFTLEIMMSSAKVFMFSEITSLGDAQGVDALEDIFFHLLIYFDTRSVIAKMNHVVWSGLMGSYKPVLIAKKYSDIRFVLCHN